MGQLISQEIYLEASAQDPARRELCFHFDLRISTSLEEEKKRRRNVFI